VRSTRNSWGRRRAEGGSMPDERRSRGKVRVPNWLQSELGRRRLPALFMTRRTPFTTVTTRWARQRALHSAKGGAGCHGVFARRPAAQGLRACSSIRSARADHQDLQTTSSWRAAPSADSGGAGACDGRSVFVEHCCEGCGGRGRRARGVVGDPSMVHRRNPAGGPTPGPDEDTRRCSSGPSIPRRWCALLGRGAVAGLEPRRATSA